MPQCARRGIGGTQHDGAPGRHQAQFPGVSSSRVSCAYLFRDSDCSLLPAMAASSFAGGEEKNRGARHFAASVRDCWWRDSPSDCDPASLVQRGDGRKPGQSLRDPLQLRGAAPPHVPSCPWPLSRPAQPTLLPMNRSLSGRH